VYIPSTSTARCPASPCEKLVIDLLHRQCARPRVDGPGRAIRFPYLTTESIQVLDRKARRHRERQQLPGHGWAARQRRHGMDLAELANPL
jgi:hypothetical protein